MSNSSKLKIGAAVLFVLWLLFGSAGFKDKFTVVALVVIVYSVVNRVKHQSELKDNAKSGMLNIFSENNFKPDYEQFHADGNQVSGVAISKDDPRMVLVSSNVPAKIFHRNDVLSISSSTGKEKDTEFKVVSLSGAGDKSVDKDVFVLDVSVKDLDTPRFKLYF